MEPGTRCRGSQSEAKDFIREHREEARMAVAVAKTAFATCGRRWRRNRLSRRSLFD